MSGSVTPRTGASGVGGLWPRLQLALLRTFPIQSSPMPSPHAANGKAWPLAGEEAAFDHGRRKRLIWVLVLAAFGRLDYTFSPVVQIGRLRRHRFEWRRDGHYLGLLALALANLSYISSPGPAIKWLILGAYTTALLVPFTCQFFLPASPVLSWVLLFWSARFFALEFRPRIWVSVLPTLESVLYGANISDLCTRYTSTLLDILAWIPYGVGHFAVPAFVAITLFLFGPPGSLKLYGRIFGYVNLAGVFIQMFVPCAPPWYELVHGMIPADYAMGGSPGGLARIDALFGGTGYTNAFTNAPVPFGAFPSLHAACATLEALFLSHFFPRWRPFYWIYVFVLYWATMYLTHHYLIDLVAGGSLAVAFFTMMMTEELRHLPGATRSPTYLASSLDKQSSNAPAVLRRALAGAESYAGISGASDPLLAGRASTDAYELASDPDDTEDDLGLDSKADDPLIVAPAIAGSDLESARTMAGSPYADRPAPGQTVFVAASSPLPASSDTSRPVTPRPRTPRTASRTLPPDRPTD